MLSEQSPQNEAKDNTDLSDCIKLSVGFLVFLYLNTIYKPAIVRLVYTMENVSVLE